MYKNVVKMRANDENLMGNSYVKLAIRLAVCLSVICCFQKHLLKFVW